MILGDCVVGNAGGPPVVHLDQAVSNPAPLNEWWRYAADGTRGIGYSRRMTW